MKKIMLIFIILNLFLSTSSIYALDSENWTTVNVGGNDFKIPPKYDGGTLKSYEYKLTDYKTFAIMEFDEKLLISNYAVWAVKSNYHEDKVIENHNIKYYIENNVSRVYYYVGDNIYGIYWQGSEITPEIEEIIKNSNASNIDLKTFNYELNKAIDMHEMQQSIDLNTQDTIYEKEHDSKEASNIEYWYYMNHYYK